MRGDALRRLCRAVARTRPLRTVVGLDGSPFLSKYRLARLGGWCLYLHRFHRGDADTELHNHPWWCASLVLVGGYREERLGADGPVRVFERRPGGVNVIARDVFHRVELDRGECWTLFLHATAAQPWGFIDRATRAFTPWREFFARKAAEADKA